MLSERNSKDVDCNKQQSQSKQDHQFNDIMTLMQLKHGDRSNGEGRDDSSTNLEYKMIKLSSSSTTNAVNETACRTKGAAVGAIEAQFKCNSNEPNENLPPFSSNKMVSNQHRHRQQEMHMNMTYERSNLIHSMNNGVGRPRPPTTTFQTANNKFQGKTNFEMMKMYPHQDSHLPMHPSRVQHNVNMINNVLYAKNLKAQNQHHRYQQQQNHPNIEKHTQRMNSWNMDDPKSKVMRRAADRMYETQPSNHADKNSPNMQTKSDSNPPKPPKKPLTSTIGCTCKKSKCLKLYCQCFASSSVCADKCVCLSCENKQGNEEKIKAAKNAILERNPRAFKAKFKQEVDGGGNVRGCGVENSGDAAERGRANGSISLTHPFAIGPNRSYDEYMRHGLNLPSSIDHQSNFHSMSTPHTLHQVNRQHMSGYQFDPYSAAASTREVNSSCNGSYSRAVSGSPISGEKPVISHSLGCKCRKSFCLKKYCECYSNEVKCGINCKCISCKNQADEVKKGFVRRQSIEMKHSESSDEKYEFRREDDRDSFDNHNEGYINSGFKRQQELRNNANNLSRYPLQEYRGGMKISRDDDISNNTSKQTTLNESSKSDHMEIMAALAMTQLCKAKSISAPSTPQRQKYIPQPISSTPESAMGQLLTSEESFNSTFSSNGLLKLKRNPPYQDENTGYEIPSHLLKRQRMTSRNVGDFATSCENFLIRRGNSEVQMPAEMQQARRFVSVSKDDCPSPKCDGLIPMKNKYVKDDDGADVRYLQSYRIIGKLPSPLSFRKICSRCGMTRGEHGELGFGNKCVFQECARCGAGIHVHREAHKLMGFLCNLTVEEGAVPGLAELYDKRLCALAKMSDLKKKGRSSALH